MQVVLESHADDRVQKSQTVDSTLLTYLGDFSLLFKSECDLIRVGIDLQQRKEPSAMPNGGWSLPPVTLSHCKSRLGVDRSPASQWEGVKGSQGSTRQPSIDR